MNPDVIILAAGKGTRMYSQLPKVLHPIGGKPMLSHVIDTARSLGKNPINVVVGFGAEQVRGHYGDDPRLVWVEQAQQLGTGHAVKQALPYLDLDGHTLILYGDVPLVKQQTLQRLLLCLDDVELAVLTLRTDKPFGLGRIIRNEFKELVAIVEEKDATPEQRQINEINTGIIAVRNDRLHEWLEALDNNNAQGEYYLTDIIEMAASAGLKIRGLPTDDQNEVQGVNNKLQLSVLERHYQRNRAEALALEGVTVMDSSRLDIRGEISVGRDDYLDVNIVMEGKVLLGNNVRIGPNVYLKDCEIADDVTVLANTHMEGAIIGSGSTIGPFARVRPGTVMAENAKVGNFVETKKSFIGRGSKINHLSYIGDSEVEPSVNIGAGTITCNYDGVNKHKTVIGEGAFIGSNAALVAPVRIGKGVTVAAGSVVTADVPDGQLAVARGRQRNIANWKRPEKASSTS